MLRILFILLFLGALSGCATLATWKGCSIKFGKELTVHDTLTNVRHDTLPVELTIKKDTIRLAGTPVTLLDTIPCPEVINNYHRTVKITGQSGQKVGVDVTIDNNKLKVDCKADSLLEVISSQTTTIRILTDSLTTINSKTTTTLVDNRSFWERLPLMVQIGIIAAFVFGLIFVMAIVFEKTKEKVTH